MLFHSYLLIFLSFPWGKIAYANGISLKINCMHVSLQEDPALTRWVFARTNPYTYFKPTYKTSLIGAMFGVVPLFVLYYVFKTDRV